MGRTRIQWGTLTASDLKTFDDFGRNIVLAAMERGGVGRLSSKGHAILRAPGGGTMSVSRNQSSANHARQNTEADFNRLFPEVEVETRGALALVPDPLPEPNILEPTLECPLDTCDAVFAIEGARYSHIEREHFKCAEPGCPAVFDKAHKATGHYNVTHGREEWEKQPAECEECDWTGTRAGLGGHRAQVHGNGNRRKKQAVTRKDSPKQPAAKAKAAPRATKGARDAEVMIERIRELIGTGTDPRVAELEAELAKAHARIAELESKLNVMREALA